MKVDLKRYREAVRAIDPVRFNGRVSKVVGLVIECIGPEVELGALCSIRPKNGGPSMQAEVVGFREDQVLLMPLGNMEGISPGCEVAAVESSLQVPVGRDLLGRILDGLGRPMDGKAPLVGHDTYPVTSSPPHPLRRTRIEEPLSLGIKALDGLITCGCGQRMGIFAGSGVGKSVLLGMIARYTEADINVIALVGERGREVKEFIERDLGPGGLKQSVVVVATSDEPALVRIKGALTATAIAESFRDQGHDVLLMMDSITRFAMAQREIGLAIGEPPTTKGYTPSVFALLPRLLERAGTSGQGSITGLYTVLLEGDDMDDPVADAVRSILDGHIVLSRELAARDHYPAVDVLHSVSRLMNEVVGEKHLHYARKLRHMLAVYRDAEDLVNIGAYEEGSNSEIDRALARIDRINNFLVQDIEEQVEFEETVSQLKKIFIQ